MGGLTGLIRGIFIVCSKPADKRHGGVIILLSIFFTVIWKALPSLFR